MIRNALREFATMGIDTIIQVGDMGIGQGAADGLMWDRLESTLVKHEQTTLVAPGNYEDTDQIDASRSRGAVGRLSKCRPCVCGALVR
ncbi:hypothetical protein [Demequina sp.]|uniref:hypothetical protein n=1 Tax=Demequina sp. TaxID=2050685 RepID=UPI003D0B0CC3